MLQLVSAIRSAMTNSLKPESFFCKAEKQRTAGTLALYSHYFRSMDFDVIQKVIRNRRSCKPSLMNGKKIEDAVIWQLLELADWAPTHAYTEPWRFVVIAGDAVKTFCSDHAEMYKANAGDRFDKAKYDKILHNGDAASHIIAVYMKRGSITKIPIIEELSAASAAVENLLLGAAALDIAALWSTGGLTFHPAMKAYFGLVEDDQMIGFLFLGYSDKAPKEGERMVPLQHKVDWRK